MLLEVLLGLLAGVFGVIVLLEDDILGSPVVVSQTFPQFILHNLDVEVPIHLAGKPLLVVLASPNPLDNRVAPRSFVSFEADPSEIFPELTGQTCFPLCFN